MNIAIITGASSGLGTEYYKVIQDEVLDEVLEDEEFYRVGGGGVTVSGGEPMLQSEALSELFAKLNNSRKKDEE